MVKKVRFFIRKGDPANPTRSEAVYIHSDTAAKLFTGDKKSPKVSDIRFEDGPQEWVAYLRDGREIFRHKERDVVVAGEAKVIEGMFARREYIPGGYMGAPRHKLPEEMCGPIESHYKYLGLSASGRDLYYSEELNAHIVVKPSSVGMTIFTDMKDAKVISDFIPGCPGNDFVDLRGGDPVNWDTEDHSSLHECVRRSIIEMAIRNEEETKLKHHQNAN